MRRFSITFWVRTKCETVLEAESSDAAEEMIANGYTGVERNLYEELDDDRDIVVTELLS